MPTVQTIHATTDLVFESCCIRLAARHFSRHSIGDQTRDLVAHLRQLM
jgi:hypothetical protein